MLTPDDEPCVCMCRMRSGRTWCCVSGAGGTASGAGSLRASTGPTLRVRKPRRLPTPPKKKRSHMDVVRSDQPGPHGSIKPASAPVDAPSTLVIAHVSGYGCAQLWHSSVGKCDCPAHRQCRAPIENTSEPPRGHAYTACRCCLANRKREESKPTPAISVVHLSSPLFLGVRPC